MAEKREFQTESKKILDIVINSIYTNKDVFLRELISNASDAIDKVYYKALSDDSIEFNREDYYIRISPDEENRTLTISDTGIGMTEKELDQNLGVIAKSGSLEFKNQVEKDQDYDIIGQFGVGFYSSFMVAKSVRVISKAFGNSEAHEWYSDGADGYTIGPAEKEGHGTDIILYLRDDQDGEDYSQYLEEYKIESLIRTYSNYIRYPIKMEVTKTRRVEKDQDKEDKGLVNADGSKIESQEKDQDQAPEYEEYKEDETLNSMVPIWRKSKNELTEDDYKNFYQEKHFGFDEPLTHIHMSVEGGVSFKALLYIPSNQPYNYYSRDYEKGLELYSSGVMIMEKCQDLLPDYFNFVKGVVDSEDLSLNISRETLQKNRQVSAIARSIEKKIKEELEKLMKDDREKYEDFFKEFGSQLKAGAYEGYGQNKEKLQDLLLFYSSYEKKYSSLKEYLDRMSEDQKYIYYASGSNLDQLDSTPQAQVVKEKGYEVLYLTENIDEFVIKMLYSYGEKEFRSVSQDDLGFEETEEEKKSQEKLNEDNKSLFEDMKKALGDEVVSVKASKRLKENPVCLTAEGDVSIEMEKTFMSYPEGQRIKAQKVLEINPDHPVFQKLQDTHSEDKDKFENYTKLLYDQARLIEGLPIDDPVWFSKEVSSLM